MKKVITLGLMLLFVGAVSMACGQSTYAKVLSNMSEMTDVYYYGETDSFWISISSGTREDEYLLNGKSEKKVDFALVCLTFADSRAANLVKVELSVGDNTQQCELEANPMKSSYMCDLGVALSGDEVIAVTYAGVTINLENISKNFPVDSKKALKIASEKLEKEILQLRSGKTLNAECYLTVMDKRSNGFETMFWCFTVINTKGENSSVIISTQDGSVLAQTEDDLAA